MANGNFGIINECHDRIVAAMAGRGGDEVTQADVRAAKQPPTRIARGNGIG